MQSQINRENLNEAGEYREKGEKVKGKEGGRA